MFAARLMEKRKKQEVRTTLRETRRQFGGEPRRQAEAQIDQELRALITGHPAGFIGVYCPFDGEVDISALWGGGLPLTSSHRDPLISRLAFPIHKSGQALSFVRTTGWIKGGKLPLPQGSPLSLQKLSLIITPGVAFDPETGIRLGLGGGHYDRTFALSAQHSWPLSTFGVGFCFQLRSGLPRESWDIPLNGVITESGVQEILPHRTASPPQSSLNERETP